MRDQGAHVAAFCSTCRTMFKIDLDAIIHAKGRAYSLIDQRGPCRRYDCEGRAFFMYSPGERMAWRPLATDAGDDARLAGIATTPDDEPPPSAPPPRCPAGVSPQAWAVADTNERARLVRQARG